MTNIKEKLIEMRGMNQSEIIKYFISINGESMGSGKFVGQDWEVEVSEESTISIGSLTIPVTTVLFSCKEERLEQMIFAFRRKFLSAGG